MWNRIPGRVLRSDHVFEFRMSAVEAGLSKKRPRRRDSESTPRYPLPQFRPFQLCTLTDDIPVGSDWLFEMKFDGYRAQVAISGSEVVVYTRNGHDWTRQFKVILPPLQALTKGSALIDGEIVAIDSQGRTNFSMLKTGIAAGMPLKFYAFDLLELNGDDLSNRPLLQRKEQLESLLGTRDPGDSLQFSGHIVDRGKKVFDAMCEGGHEGVIAKRADSRYIGDRTASWLKIKCTKRQEFVVGGYRPSDTGRGMASLILGTYENGKLIYRGRVGTGFTQAMRDTILAQLETAAPRQTGLRFRPTRHRPPCPVGEARACCRGHLCRSDTGRQPAASKLQGYARRQASRSGGDGAATGWYRHSRSQRGQGDRRCGRRDPDPSRQSHVP